MPTTPTTYAEVLAANVDLHSRMAADYSRAEPHFRPENLQKVRARLAALAPTGGGGRLLDLGCGTGFMINLARNLFGEIVGVDATQAMLDQVDRSGPAQITLHCDDTGAFAPAPGSFDVVSAYSFLHHLYDIRPTLRTAAAALRPGGVFYGDLDPNRDFWAALQAVDPKAELSPLVRAELGKLRGHDQEVAVQLGIAPALLDLAEYGKNITGGFSGDELAAALREAGFSQVEVFYHWFLGEAQVLHSPDYPLAEGQARAAQVHEALRRAMPLSRGLYKYLGFVARR